MVLTLKPVDYPRFYWKKLLHESVFFLLLLRPRRCDVAKELIGARRD